MRLIFFGTYDPEKHPRIAVLKEGFQEHADEVVECRQDIGIDTQRRVRLLRSPWLAPAFAGRILGAWLNLIRKARRLPPAEAVVVGYLGHFDVLLARVLFRGTPVVLDHLVSAKDTAADRGVRSPLVLAPLGALDAAAVAASDICLVDTPGQIALIPARLADRACVVAVGASRSWFSRPRPSGSCLKVVFFGTFTPLQGAPVIGRAAAGLAGLGSSIELTMVGAGQDYERTRGLVGEAAVRWVQWLKPEALRNLVKTQDVCLGIFGTSPKARRVVPNKVYQGAASGCAIVTSDTPAQHEALGESALFVEPGNAASLAEAILRLQSEEGLLDRLKLAAYERASARFNPADVVAGLRRRLVDEAGKNDR